MPAIVACPQCQARYQLPDNAVGKQIQCKKCSHKFAATPIASPQVQSSAIAQGAAKSQSPVKGQAAAKVPANVAASSTSAASRSPVRTIPSAPAAALAKFGLDGPILRQADILPDLPSPPPRDILGNLAADPGFAADSIVNDNARSLPGSKNSASDEEDLSSIVKNPYENHEPKKVALNTSRGDFKNLHWPVTLTRWGAWGIAFSLLAFFLAAGLEFTLVYLGVTAVPRILWLFLRLGVFSWIITVPACSLLFTIGLTMSTFCSAHNLRVLGTESLRFGPGLLTGSWFLPIFNLFWPFLGLAEIVRASKKPFSSKWSNQKFPTQVLLAWILLFLAMLAGVLVPLAPIALIALGLVNPNNPDESARVVGMVFVATLVFYCACSAGYLVVLADLFETVKNDQEQAYSNPPKKRQ